MKIELTFVLVRYWGPMVSTRTAHDIRKKALREGTYGKFTPDLGKGLILFLIAAHFQLLLCL
jgi:hypothetical protein